MARNWVGEVNDKLVVAPRRFMAQATVKTLLDREVDHLTSIASVKTESHGQIPPDGA